jgi:hypothetical protein
MTADNFLHINHGLSVMRIVRKDDGLFSFNSSMSQITPHLSKLTKETVMNVIDSIQSEDMLINIFFGYAKGSLSKSKKKRLTRLLKTGDTDCDYKSILDWVLLL